MDSQNNFHEIEITVWGKGFVPIKGTDGSAGFDLYSAVDKWISSNSQELIDTNISISIPKGYVGFIKDRSGFAYKKRIVTNAGVIDSDYRGEVKVLLSNESNKAFKVNIGDRVAQIVFLPILEASLQKKKKKSLSHTARGCGGFGHTGK